VTNNGNYYLPTAAGGERIYLGKVGTSVGIFRTNNLPLAAWDNDLYEYANNQLTFDLLSTNFDFYSPVRFDLGATNNSASGWNGNGKNLTNVFVSGLSTNGGTQGQVVANLGSGVMGFTNVSSSAGTVSNAIAFTQGNVIVANNSASGVVSTNSLSAWNLSVADIVVTNGIPLYLLQTNGTSVGNFLQRIGNIWTNAAFTNIPAATLGTNGSTAQGQVVANLGAGVVGWTNVTASGGGGTNSGPITLTISTTNVAVNAVTPIGCVTNAPLLF